MKSLTLRSCVVACALSLAACGGSGGSLALSGSVVTLTKEGLVLKNNVGGATLAVSAHALRFQFAELIGNDSQFDVEILTQPPGAKCVVTGGKGKTNANNVTSIVVTCTTDTHDLGGTISGLDADGLTLVNGSDVVVVPKDAVSFAMAKVADGSPYGVTVLKQPAPRTCTVQNGADRMGTTDRPLAIAITCI